MFHTGNYLFSQDWFATVQDVLHADWQDVWHSPQPPVASVFCKDAAFNVLTSFIVNIPFRSDSPVKGNAGKTTKCQSHAI